MIIPNQKKKQSQKSIDNNTRNIVVISSFIVTLVTIVRVSGAVISYKQIQQIYKSTPLESEKEMEALVNLGLAVFGLIAMLLFSLLSAFVRRFSVQLKYSLEFLAIAHTISFPYYTKDYEQILIQYAQFQITTIYIISCQTVLLEMPKSKQFLIKIPIAIIGTFSQGYIFHRCVESQMRDLMGDVQLFKFLGTILGLLGLMGISTFVFQLMRMQSYLNKKQKTKRLQQDYQNVIETFAEGILICSVEGKLLYINQELKDFIELNEEDDQLQCFQKPIFRKYGDQQFNSMKGGTSSSTSINNLTLKDIMSAPQALDSERDFYELLQNQDQNANNKFSSSNDEKTSVEVQKIKIQFNQQEAYLLIVKNISSILDYEKQKNDQKYQQALIGTVSHEMLTPLNSIIGISNILKMKFEISNDHTSLVIKQQNSNQTQKNDNLYLVKIINNSAHMMHYLVQDILDLQKIMLGTLQTNDVYCNVKDCCSEILELFSIQMQGKSIFSNTICSQSDPQFLYFDKEKYQQVLMNIISNSVKFTNQGQINIQLDFLKTTECPYLHCGELITSVKDTGIGMDELTQKNLFQIFGNMKRDFEGGIMRQHGIGLGLSICKELVQFLGGKISCESVHGQGTRMEFSIQAYCQSCKQQERQIIFEEENIDVTQNEGVSILMKSQSKDYSSYRVESQSESRNIKVEECKKPSDQTIKKRIFGDVDVQQFSNLARIQSIISTHQLKIKQSRRENLLKYESKQRKFDEFMNLGGNNNSIFSSDKQSTSNQPQMFKSQQQMTKLPYAFDCSIFKNQTVTPTSNQNKYYRIADYDNDSFIPQSYFNQQQFCFKNNSLGEEQMFQQEKQQDERRFFNDGSKLTITDIDGPNQLRILGERKGKPINNNNAIQELMNEEEESNDGGIRLSVAKETEVNVQNIYINIPQENFIQHLKSKNSNNRNVIELNINSNNTINNFKQRERKTNDQSGSKKININNSKNCNEQNIASTSRPHEKEFFFSFVPQSNEEEIKIDTDHKSIIRTEPNEQYKQKSSVYTQHQLLDFTAAFDSNQKIYISNQNENSSVSTMKKRESMLRKISEKTANFHTKFITQVQKESQKGCSCESTVLIVDDNMFNLIPLELILKEMFGINVDKALNGQEAVNMYTRNLLKKCCETKYKLILMDLNMPIMDGYEATLQIISQFKRLYPEGQYLSGDKMFVVAITAFVNDENIKNCYKVGMKEVLHKPVNIDSLRRVLDFYYHYKQIQ